MCAKHLECDPTGKTPKCLDVHGKAAKVGDLEATCSAGKYNVNV